MHAGETGGILDTILRRLAVFLEKSEALKRKVKGAMIYPAVVVTIAVSVVVILLIFVIPVFKEMFEGAGQKLPGPTLLVLAMSDFLQKSHSPHDRSARHRDFRFSEVLPNRKGKVHRGQFVPQSPRHWHTTQKGSRGPLCSTLGTMISSGVPILDALEITAKTAGNVVIETAIMNTRTAIAEGRTIAKPLMETRVFPGMVVRMIAVGEATGALDAMLAKISNSTTKRSMPQWKP